jgi:hypothetical protein
MLRIFLFGLSNRRRTAGSQQPERYMPLCLKEMRAMPATSLEATLEEWGFTEKWEARGLEKGRIDAVRRLQKYGMDPMQIADALELPLGTVFRYLETE